MHLEYTFHGDLCVSVDTVFYPWTQVTDKVLKRKMTRLDASTVNINISCLIPADKDLPSCNNPTCSVVKLLGHLFLSHVHDTTMDL